METTNSLSNLSYGAQSPCKPNTAHVNYWQLSMNSFKKSILLFQWIWLVVLILSLNVHKQICQARRNKERKIQVIQIIFP